MGGIAKERLKKIDGQEKHWKREPEKRGIEKRGTEKSRTKRERIEIGWTEKN